MAGRIAEWLGRLVHLLLIGIRESLKAAPGITGACAIVWGVSSINAAAGWIVAGVFLLLIDRRIK